VGRDPFALLAAVTEPAGEMWLGTSIATIWGRDAMAMKMASRTLEELTAGRFVLGLGVSHPHLAQKLRGHVYEKPLTRMREYLDAMERLPYRGPAPSEEGPPVLLAALRERMLELAATSTAGAFPYLVTAERVAWMRGRLDAARSDPRPLLAVTLPAVLGDEPAAARRVARAYLAPYLRTPNYQASWEAQGFGPDDWAQPGSDRLVDAMVAWGVPGQVERRLRDLHDAGVDHVALIPLSPQGVTEHLPTLEALQPAG
jgi:probable F420-dependent oxidoreductase